MINVYLGMYIKVWFWNWFNLAGSFLTLFQLKTLHFDFQKSKVEMKYFKVGTFPVMLEEHRNISVEMQINCSKFEMFCTSLYWTVNWTNGSHIPKVFPILCSFILSVKCPFRKLNTQNCDSENGQRREKKPSPNQTETNNNCLRWIELRDREWPKVIQLTFIPKRDLECTLPQFVV